jgi:hypothetical protein
MEKILIYDELAKKLLASTSITQGQCDKEVGEELETELIASVSNSSSHTNFLRPKFFQDIEETVESCLHILQKNRMQISRGKALPDQQATELGSWFVRSQTQGLRTAVACLLNQADPKLSLARAISILVERPNLSKRQLIKFLSILLNLPNTIQLRIREMIDCLLSQPTITQKNLKEIINILLQQLNTRSFKAATLRRRHWNEILVTLGDTDSIARKIKLLEIENKGRKDKAYLLSSPQYKMLLKEKISSNENTRKEFAGLSKITPRKYITDFFENRKFEEWRHKGGNLWTTEMVIEGLTQEKHGYKKNLPHAKKLMKTFVGECVKRNAEWSIVFCKNFKGAIPHGGGIDKHFLWQLCRDYDQKSYYYLQAVGCWLGAFGFRKNQEQAYKIMREHRITF